MPTPTLNTLVTDAQGVLNLQNMTTIRSAMAVALANANTGTPLNPNLTNQQLINETFQVMTLPKSDIESIIVNQLMKFMFAPTFPSATITGDLTVDTSTLKVDSTNHRVGIKQASPSHPFQIGTTDLILDASSNLGLGVTPSAWNNDYKPFQLGSQGGFVSGRVSTGTFELGTNCYKNSAGNWIYTANNFAIRFVEDGVTGQHQWYTAPSGIAGNAITFTQAMTLDANGNLLVGKTASYGTGESNYIQVKSGVVYAADNIGSASNRNWTVSPNGSSAGALDWTISSTNNNWPNFAYRMQLTSAGALNNTTGTYGTISDLRLKENISDARNYLADLLKLRVVKYSLKEEASAVATKLGFIAQEVEQVFPNLVEQSDKEYEGAEGIRSVKTSILIPMLLKAIQELTARVQTLETR